MSKTGPNELQWVVFKVKKTALRRTLVIALLGLLMIATRATPARAQHGDYLLGTVGLLGAQQPPEGLFYQNLWSYYRASGGGFIEANNILCGKRGRLCLGVNASASASLDMFVDQNIFWLITPFKIPYIDATYGAMIDVPFAIADTSGSGGIQPNLTFEGRNHNFNLSGPTLNVGGGVTKGSIGDIWFEPIDLGWHFKHLDMLVTGSFMAPTGPYNADANVNIGYGHWSGDLGLGGIIYPDEARLWSLSIMSHYEMYSSQEGRPYVLGDQLPFEWGTGKTFNLPSRIFQQLTIGAVGYAQWQTTDNQIQVSTNRAIGNAIKRALMESNASVYSAGPAVQLLTTFGLFDLRYYNEFGAQATPSGQQLMFSVALAGKPW